MFFKLLPGRSMGKVLYCLLLVGTCLSPPECQGQALNGHINPLWVESGRELLARQGGLAAAYARLAASRRSSGLRGASLARAYQGGAEPEYRGLYQEGSQSDFYPGVYESGTRRTDYPRDFYPAGSRFYQSTAAGFYPPPTGQSRGSGPRDAATEGEPGAPSRSGVKIPSASGSRTTARESCAQKAAAYPGSYLSGSQPLLYPSGSQATPAYYQIGSEAAYPRVYQTGAGAAYPSGYPIRTQAPYPRDSAYLAPAAGQLKPALASADPLAQSTGFRYLTNNGGGSARGNLYTQPQGSPYLIKRSSST